jgi:hypothetical protein
VTRTAKTVRGSCMDCLDAEYATNFAGRKILVIAAFAKRQYARNVLLNAARRAVAIANVSCPVNFVIFYTAGSVRDYSSVVSAATHTAPLCAKIPSFARRAKVISAVNARIPACVPNATMNFVSIVERRLLAIPMIATTPFVASSA